MAVMWLYHLGEEKRSIPAASHPKNIGATGYENRLAEEKFDHHLLAERERRSCGHQFFASSPRGAKG